MAYPPRMRFAALDAWRGIAALSVAWLHFSATVRIALPSFVENAWVFVDFFFVLSGFVLTHAYRDKIRDGKSAWPFLLRRFGRLWPLHIFVMAIMVLMEGVKFLVLRSSIDVHHAPFSGVSDPQALLAHALLFQVFIPLSWNEPSWSISAEFIAYLTFAVFSLIVAGRQKRGVVLAFVIIIASAFIVEIERYGFDLSIGASKLARTFMGFYTGYLVYLLPAASLGFVKMTVLEILCLLLIIGFVTFDTAAAVPALAAVLFAGTVWLFAQEGGALSRLMHMAIFQRLGEWSYSIYMTHTFVLIVSLTLIARLPFIDRLPQGMIAAHPGWLGYAVLAFCTAATLAVSALTYMFVECPGGKYFNGLAGAYTKRVAAAAVPRSATT